MHIASPAVKSAFCLLVALSLSVAAHAQRTGSKSGKGALDTTAPVLTLPANMRIEASSSAGATVAFSATATDDVDRKVTVTCTPASGATVPLGSTSVLCESKDSAGNRATGSFSIGVVDTTAPTVTMPGAMTAEASSSTGTAVSYTVSANDKVDNAAAARCTPASGSVFPPGTTAVTCSATDFSGNRGAGSFSVTVDVAAPVVASSAPAPAVSYGSATLNWSAPTTRADGQPLAMSEIASYEIYMLAESTGASRVISIADPASTAQTIDGLTPDTYHFAISAIDTSGLVSDMSPTVSKQIP